MSEEQNVGDKIRQVLFSTVSETIVTAGIDLDKVSDATQAELEEVLNSANEQMKSIYKEAVGVMINDVEEALVEAKLSPIKKHLHHVVQAEELSEGALGVIDEIWELLA